MKERKIIYLNKGKHSAMWAKMYIKRTRTNTKLFLYCISMSFMKETEEGRTKKKDETVKIKQLTDENQNV